MGKPDQLAKRILTEETAKVTGDRVSFEVPREVAVGALQPDGVVRGVIAPGLAGLDAPWSRLKVEATLDVKMPGDHLDRAALARCEFRRHARWVQHLEGTPAPVDPDPRDFAMWVLAPHPPRWLRDDAERGVIEFDEVATGCWTVGPGDHETLWIAANELPLRVELIPFLVARSGPALVEFLLWSATVKGAEWTRSVVMELGMSSNIADEVLRVPDDEAEQYRIKTAFTRRLLEVYPEAANEILERGIEKGAEQAFSYQFGRKLSRALTAAEHEMLMRRIHTLGTARVGDVVLDLTAAELGTWLRDPDAK